MSVPNSAAMIEKTERILRRRSREELEALAAEFVGAGSRRQRVDVRQVLGATAIAIVAGAVILWLMLPDFTPTHAAPRSVSHAAEDAQAAAQRLAERRERKRRELESTSAYLDRMAQADRALIREMSERATKLAQKAGAPAGTSAAAPDTRGAPAVAPAERPSPEKKPPAAAKPAEVAKAAAPPAASPAPAQAQAKAGAPAQCEIHVSELSASGKLTYDDVAHMKGARVEKASGNVFTPPVQVAGYGNVVFEVHPDGCVKVVRSSISR